MAGCTCVVVDEEGIKEVDEGAPEGEYKAREKGALHQTSSDNSALNRGGVKKLKPTTSTVNMWVVDECFPFMVPTSILTSSRGYDEMIII